MKILYVASRFPFPVTGGREHMIMQSLKALSELGDVELISFSSERPTGESIIAFEKKTGVKFIGNLTPSNPILAAVKAALKKCSMQSAMYLNKKSISIFRTLIANSRHDVCVFDMLRTSSYAQYVDSKSKLVLELDDLLSKRYYRQANSKYFDTKLLGARSTGISDAFVNWISKFVGAWVLKRESTYISRLENQSPKNFSLVTLTSPLEAEELKKTTGNANIIAFPPSHDLSNKKYSNDTSDNVIRMVFIGNLNVSHNFASLSYIFKNILPLVLNYPDFSFKLDIIGSVSKSLPVADLDRLLNLNVEYCGFVENIDDLMSKATVMLCPIAYGSGVKLKVIEALKYSIPVITNSVGGEGIHVGEENGIIVTDSPSEMIYKIVEIKSDKLLNESIKVSARRNFENNFDYHKNKQRYISSILERVE